MRSVVEPYVDSVVVAGGLLERAGGERATSLLEKVVAGTAIVALAAGEPESGDRWQDVATTARARRRRLDTPRPQGRSDERAIGHPSVDHREHRPRAFRCFSSTSIR